MNIHYFLRLKHYFINYYCYNCSS